MLCKLFLNPPQKFDHYPFLRWNYATNHKNLSMVYLLLHLFWPSLPNYNNFESRNLNCLPLHSCLVCPITSSSQGSFLATAWLLKYKSQFPISLSSDFLLNTGHCGQYIAETFFCHLLLKSIDSYVNRRFNFWLLTVSWSDLALCFTI